MCNTANKQNLFFEVNDLFNEAMNDNFIIDGVVYNMAKLGYKWSWNTNKSRSGVHKARYSDKSRRIFLGGRIELSEWILRNSDRTYDDWYNTILHEIAHAIDHQIRKDSPHDEHWRRIALALGCNGKRCGDFEIDHTVSKYYFECINCGEKTPSHKIKRVRTACGTCCYEYNNGKFSEKYLLIQHKNY